jgi:hypothetical protein
MAPSLAEADAIIARTNAEIAQADEARELVFA